MRLHGVEHGDVATVQLTGVAGRRVPGADSFCMAQWAMGDEASRGLTSDEASGETMAGGCQVLQPVALHAAKAIAR